MVSAGIIVIGNEVLSGKVDEANARFLITELRALGVRLERIAIIRDELSEIAREVKAMSALYDHVITSGGVGSTHDDVTMEGVALGLEVPLVRNKWIEARIIAHFAERATPSVLRMADVPAGADLVGTESRHHPVVRAKNVWILPGVPEYLRAKFEIMRPFFATDPIHLRQIFVGLPEDRIGDVLRDALAAVPGVEIGSYPRFDEADHKVKVTVESRDRSAVDRAIEFLLAHVPSDAVVRVE